MISGESKKILYLLRGNIIFLINTPSWRLRDKYRVTPAGFFAALFFPFLFSGLPFRQDVNAVNEES